MNRPLRKLPAKRETRQRNRNGTKTKTMAAAENGSVAKNDANANAKPFLRYRTLMQRQSIAIIPTTSTMIENVIVISAQYRTPATGRPIDAVKNHPITIEVKRKFSTYSLPPEYYFWFLFLQLAENKRRKVEKKNDDLNIINLEENNKRDSRNSAKSKESKRDKSSYDENEGRKDKRPSRKRPM